MKKTLITLTILINTLCYSQNFSGDYRSYKTSFQDNSSKENNFIEESEFKITILIDKNNTEGSIAIQDPRIPDKLLFYEVVDYLGKIKDNGTTNYLYKCLTQHLDNPIETTIVFYYPTDKKLSLMVYNKESSQVFFDLKINNK
ncbi:hypothetical protein EC396_04155 [Lutibacter sp. HS1-25]|uniref:hypothetical protein n=1 Tax=Lutibacter sp. HS1-25 TaxID=2485000 RepID=UPI00101014B3|nr:hypothetical protein [Lutibacter sp. HS1-25]RXP61394.1 hypothetical protein EC396_04155 [Lutibacter sp. HS1-25]